MKKKIDINCDLGEHDTIDLVFMDAIMPHISSANISCGAHSGNEEVIRSTIQKAKEYNLAIGAHPSYPDRLNFGRLSMQLDRLEFEEMLNTQLHFFQKICAEENVILNHIKPHGALYNDLASSESLSDWFLDFISELNPKMKVFGLAHSIFQEQAENKSINFIKEGFLDRQYTTDLKLASRKLEGSVLTDSQSIIHQLDQILEGFIIVDGQKMNLEVDTLCLHGDTEGAVTLAQKISDHLKSKAVEVTPS